MIEENTLKYLNYIGFKISDEFIVLLKLLDHLDFVKKEYSKDIIYIYDDSIIRYEYKILEGLPDRFSFTKIDYKDPNYIKHKMVSDYVCLSNTIEDINNFDKYLRKILNYLIRKKKLDLLKLII